MLLRLCLRLLQRFHVEIVVGNHLVKRTIIGMMYRRPFELRYMYPGMKSIANLGRSKTMDGCFVVAVPSFIPVPITTATTNTIL